MTMVSCLYHSVLRRIDVELNRIATDWYGPLMMAVLMCILCDEHALVSIIYLSYSSIMLGLTSMCNVKFIIFSNVLMLNILWLI